MNKELTVNQIKKYIRSCRDYEVFDLFDDYRDRYGRYDRRTSAIACEIERRGYEPEPIMITAADLHDYISPYIY